MGEPGYKKLKSYQQSEIICDFTFDFCGKYLDQKSRTNDQMNQAARSGKQNIVEGCSASENNPKTELFLLNVARASFQELLEDYNDFLRQRNFNIWNKDNSKAIEIRNLPYKPDLSYQSYKQYINDPETAANAMLTLINQTNYLLDSQIKAVKVQMEEKGIDLESHSQKVGRILRENLKKEREFDQWIAQELDKARKKDL